VKRRQKDQCIPYASYPIYNNWTKCRKFYRFIGLQPQFRDAFRNARVCVILQYRSCGEIIIRDFLRMIVINLHSGEGLLAGGSCGNSWKCENQRESVTGFASGSHFPSKISSYSRMCVCVCVCVCLRTCADDISYKHRENAHK